MGRQCLCAHNTNPSSNELERGDAQGVIGTSVTAPVAQMCVRPSSVGDGGPTSDSELFFQPLIAPQGGLSRPGIQGVPKLVPPSAHPFPDKPAYQAQQRY